MAYIYDKNGNPKFYTSGGKRYNMDGSYAGHTGRDNYNYDRNGNRTSYNSRDGYTYRMDGSRAGYRSGDTYYDNSGRPKYHKY